MPAVEASPGAPATETSFTMLAVGDLMCHAAQLKAARAGGGYSFGEAFAAVAPTIAAADLAIGNLETTLSDRGFRGYPAFRSPTAYADALRGAGFDLVSTANNHALDGGARGVGFTTAYLDSIGMRHVGTGDPSPAIVEVNGIKVAFVSYTYATNGIRSPFATAVNRMDLGRIRADIQSVRPSVDLVVVFLHWGAEYKTGVEPSTRALGRALVDSGADLVLGSHPHVVRPIEVYNGRYIVYSMGNFISGQSKKLTDLGIAVRLKVVKGPGGTTVGDVRVMPAYRDRSPGARRSAYRTLFIDEALATPDRLVSAADRKRMASYRTFCQRMFPGLY